MYLGSRSKSRNHLYHVDSIIVVGLCCCFGTMEKEQKWLS